AAVFETFQSFEQDARYITLGNCTYYSTHGATPDVYFLVGRFHPSILLWRPRATARLASGTSRVITEPAPMVAFSPSFAGATILEFEPINTPSAISVRNLFTPS